MSPNAPNVALASRLAQAGVPIFPCNPATKRPVSGLMWASMSTCDPALIADWWRRTPDAMPGIDLRKAGFLVIDLDGEIGLSDWAALIDEHGAVDAPSIETPSGGRHVYFRQPGTLGNGRGALPPKRENPATGKAEGIDVRGAGGYVIAPGAMRADGVFYDDVDLDAVRPPPSWLVDLLTAGKPSGAPQPLLVPIRPTDPTRAQAYVHAALEEECRQIANAPPGMRNETASRSAFKIGGLVGGGEIPEAEAIAALEAAARSWGVPASDKVFGPRGTIQRQVRAGAAISPRSVPEPEPVPVVRINLGQRAPAPAKVELPATPEPRGLIAEIAEWVLRSSTQPNPPLALASAIATLAGVCGRHLYGPTLTSLNLYVVMLAPTGVGKDRPLSAPAELFKAIGHPALAQTGKFFSVSALESILVERAGAVGIVDEIGDALLARMTARTASTHEVAIKSAILELWRWQYGKPAFSTTARAASKPALVPSPAWSIFGASTPERFYACLGNSAVADGFLNRFLIVPAAARGPFVDVTPDVLKPPSDMVRRLAAIVPDQAGGGNIASRVDPFSGLVEPAADVLAWGPGAYDAFKAMREDVAQRMESMDRGGELLSRTAETAVRLASLHAVGRAGRGAAVTVEDFAWGAGMALSSAMAMVEQSQTMMAASQYEQGLNAVLAVVKKQGPVTRRDLLRSVRTFSTRDIDQVLAHLAGAGMIVAIERPAGSAGGRPTVEYQAA